MSRTHKATIVDTPYDVLTTIGQGSAAIVYKVRDRRDGAVKAMKQLRPESLANDKIVRRFEEEFRILRALHHPSLPEVHEYGWADDDSRYMVMEFVEGQPLDRYLADHPDDLWIILYQLCEALTFIHFHDLLHQDIKPDNILVKHTTAFGDPMPLAVLIDFGLTHRRRAGEAISMVGTPAYMAPEIIRGEAPLTRAVDYYSLGVTLYELIVGDLPFKGTGRQVFAAHLDQDVTFPREQIQYAELYPHIRGLMAKDKRARLDAFENFKRSVIARMTGGIQELEKAYGLARINSLGMIGKNEVWKELMEWVEEVGGEEGSSDPREASLVGAPGAGKTYMLTRLASELTMRGIGTFWCDLREADLLVGQCLPMEDHPRAWDLIAAAGSRSGSAVVIVDNADDLDDAQDELISYLRRRSRLEETKRKGFRTRFLYGRSSLYRDATAQSSRSMREVVIKPLDTEDYETVVSSVGSMLTAQDGNDLRRVLQSFGLGMDSVCSVLAEAVMEEALTFVAGRWHFEPSGFAPDVGDGARYAGLIKRLSARDRWVISVVACNVGPMGPDAIDQVLDVNDGDSLPSLERLRSIGFLRPIERNGMRKYVFQASGVREVVYATLPEDFRVEMHRRMRTFVEKGLCNERQAPGQIALLREDLSFHLEGLSEHREAFRNIAGALHFYRRSDDLSSIRSLVRRGLDLCRTWKASGVSHESARLMSLYLVKVMLAEEWRRNNLHNVRRLVESEFVINKAPIPAAFVPKYARALQAAGALAEASDILEESMASVPVNTTPHLRMRTELALVQMKLSKYTEALETLDGITSHIGRLDNYYRCRVYLHYCMCYDYMSLAEKALESAGVAEKIAGWNGFVYEQAVVYQVRANVLFSKQELARSMSTIAQGVRFCGKHGELRNLQMFYFLASAIYFSMGDYGRCLRYLGKATQIGERLGDERTVGVYLTRFAMIYHGQGEYGNAMRYLDRAKNILDSLRSHGDSTLASLARLDISLDLGLEDREELIASLEGMCGDRLSLSRQGYYQHLLGRYYEARGDVTSALSSYQLARDLFVEGDILDDAFLATIALARLSRRSGSLDAYKDYLVYLEEQASNVESSNVRALLSFTKLEEAVEQRDNTQRMAELAMRCEIDRAEVTEVFTQITLDPVIFRAWQLLGEEAQARSAFERFYANVKKILANLPDRSIANQFLAKQEISELLEEYRDFGKNSN